MKERREVSGYSFDLHRGQLLTAQAKTRTSNSGLHFLQSSRGFTIHFPSYLHYCVNDLVRRVLAHLLASSDYLRYIRQINSPQNNAPNNDCFPKHVFSFDAVNFSLGRNTVSPIALNLSYSPWQRIQVSKVRGWPHDLYREKSDEMIQTSRAVRKPCSNGQTAMTPK